ncbi:Aste57867_22508 [Aphanomyces stellatus]|uniref:Aste57867_22508 protein n=1 Tax=Aphanomyces stellatus TaxID=120398 RepID=A0A485KFE5_9STRA|nr:hypothetical protein As57867_022438 [Aphanomyces stellatus]KAF0708402.1 hypothetical protein As57867_006347 [Aphanomyces stellatus]VFT83358.1 Aste57867_6362 [Aphanomyces stellatus]VFT99168.1 Aste57867_22508 [Aphanomyces stellatus]
MMLHAAILADDTVGFTDALSASLAQVNVVHAMAAYINHLRRMDIGVDDGITIEVEGTPLLLAVYLGRTNMAKLLIACDRLDINGTNQTNDTPLGIATIGGHMIKNSAGSNAMTHAVEKQHVESLKLLLVHGNRRDVD